MRNMAINTNKMSVIINDTFVTKIFLHTSNYKKRYSIEKQALILLEELENTPNIISFSDKTPSLTLTRLKGQNIEQFSDVALIKLRKIVLETIKLGIARHALPIRDILVDKNDTVGIVDFERATLKKNNIKPIWYIATKVTKFHLIRFIYSQNPKLLTSTELLLLKIGFFIRIIFTKMKKSYKKIIKSFRNKTSSHKIILE